MTSKAISLTIIAIAAIFIAVNSYMYPWVGDDVCYEFACDGGEQIDEIREVKTFSDVWKSQVAHYISTNGRMPVHLAIQAFTGPFGKLAFAIANGICFALFLTLIVISSYPPNLRNSPWAQLTALLPLLFLFPAQVGRL